MLDPVNSQRKDRTAGVDRASFAQAAHGMTDWIRAQHGFVARRLSVAVDGTWVEQVQWGDMASAKAAAAAIGPPRDR
jgi:hypothetical protein